MVRAQVCKLAIQSKRGPVRCCLGNQFWPVALLCSVLPTWKFDSRGSWGDEVKKVGCELLYSDFSFLIILLIKLNFLDALHMHCISLNSVNRNFFVVECEFSILWNCWGWGWGNAFNFLCHSSPFTKWIRSGWCYCVSFFSFLLKQPVGRLLDFPRCAGVR